MRHNCGSTLKPPTRRAGGDGGGGGGGEAGDWEWATNI